MNIKAITEVITIPVRGLKFTFNIIAIIYVLS